MAVEDLYKRALDAVERNNYGYAVEILREVLRQDPNYEDARSILRASERRVADATSSVVSMVLLPLHMAVAGVKALLAKGRKKLEVYEDFLKNHPRSFWGLTGAAHAAAEAELPEVAVEVYRDALKQKPESKKALRAISDVLLEMGNTREALNYLSRLSALKPDDRDLLREVRNLEATDHMASHKMEEAESFRDMIRDKDQAEEFEEERRMAVSMDDLSREAAQLKEQLEENPKQVNRILRLAQLYQDTGRLQQAEEFLKEKHELLPDNYEIREKLGDVRLARYDKALAAAKKAVKENPGDEELQAKRDKLAEARTQFGIKEYQWRQNQHPTDREIQFQLGRFEFEAGNYNEAIAAFQGVAGDARYTERAMMMLGMCFMHKEQYDLALERFDEVLERHPEMDERGKEIRYLQAQAHEAMGQDEEALSIYKKIYSQDINFRDVDQRVTELSG